MLSVSVVIIGKNEEQNIVRCICSIEKALHNNFDYEIIYIDSDSSDNTINMIDSHNVKIFVIDKSERMTASKGRYVGALNSSKEYILFLDADMEVFEGWIETAIKVISNNPLYAGVIGIRNDIIFTDSNIISIKSNCYNIHKLKPTSHFGGALLIKTKDLMLAGNYCPNIIANEEAELHSRIMSKNKIVVEIPQEMINHYIPIEKTKNSINRILFGKRQLGVGQGCANAIRNKSLRSFILRFKFLFASIIIDVISLILLIYGVKFDLKFLYYVLMLQLIQLVLNLIFRKWHFYIIDKIQSIYILPGILSYKHQVDVKYKRIR